MANNINPLPIRGRLSLQDIADAFYLYKSHSEGGTVALDDYYGDLIKYYTPVTPPIPLSASKTIGIDVFHGKRYRLPIPLTINSVVNNYNVYDQAAAYAQATYGLKLNTPSIPFVITVTNNSTVKSSILKTPAITTNVVSFNTPGIYTWSVPAGVNRVSISMVGGGGGSGSTGIFSGIINGGGGGGGAQVIVANDVVVTPSTVLSVTVGTGGVAVSGTDSTLADGGDGGNSVILAYTAIGGKGGKTATGAGGGAGGAAGGAGGAAGSQGRQDFGGFGGNTLASPYGVGGSAASTVTPGTAGAGGSVVITYATVGAAAARATQNTAAMIIGTSSDGRETLNQYTTVEIINNGSILGAPDDTPPRSFSGNGSFTVNEGQNTVAYDLGGGGGNGGNGGHADNEYTTGQGGGKGDRQTGNMAVNQGDIVKYQAAGPTGTAVLYKNGVTQVAAGGGPSGSNGQRWGRFTSLGSASNAGNGDGGAGGGGGGWADGAGYYSSFGKSGGGGWASVSYQPNLPGGPALYLTKPASIQNNGDIGSGPGAGSYTTVGTNYVVIGSGFLTVTNGPKGKITGQLA
jgi:hypothetical protein